MKKRVGVFMGGYSSEAGISMQSGQTVLNHLDTNLFDCYGVHISKNAWLVKQGDESWPLNRESLTFLKNGVETSFDVIFNAIHGHPGEDGYLQALFDLNGIPHSSSGFFESALTFNKHKTNTLLKSQGITVPKSKFITNDEHIIPEQIAEEFGLPLFVKPNRSGSSFGVTKVSTVDKLPSAIEAALKEDDQIIIEEAIIGTEVGCGVCKHDGITESIAVTEIVSKNDFFDYEAKYLGASEEITPARISAERYAQISKTSEFIYNYLNLWGLVRIDYIIRNDVAYLIEVNSIPGLSPASIVPQQLAYRGWSLSSFFGGLLMDSMNKKH